jgi:hypothetical protein
VNGHLFSGNQQERMEFLHLPIFKNVANLLVVQLNLTTAYLRNTINTSVFYKVKRIYISVLFMTLLM